MKQVILDYYEKLEGFFKSFFDETILFKSFELYNFNDDYVIYCSIYILVAIFLFILCALTNFYRIKPAEVIYVNTKSETSPVKKSGKKSQ